MHGHRDDSCVEDSRPRRRASHRDFLNEILERATGQKTTDPLYEWQQRIKDVREQAREVWVEQNPEYRDIFADVKA